MPDSKKTKFGLALPNFLAPGNKLDFARIEEYAQKAERLDFQSLWAWEHLFLGTRKAFPVFDALTLLPAIAATTRTIRLGTSVVALPIRNPVILAKNVATLDNISSGRITLGISAGWYKKEFDACGVPFNLRGKITETNLALLKRLWTEDDVNGDYGTCHLEHVTLEPKPVQKPHPPVMMGGYADPVLRRAGIMADGWLTYFYTPEAFSDSWNKVRDAATAAGRDADGLANADILLGYVSSTGESGVSEAKDFVSKTFDLPPWSKASVDSALIGTREQCREKVRRYIEAGVEQIIIIPLKYDSEQVDIFAREIIPNA